MHIQMIQYPKHFNQRNKVGIGRRYYQGLDIYLSDVMSREKLLQTAIFELSANVSVKADVGWALGGEAAAHTHRNTPGEERSQPHVGSGRLTMSL